MKIMNVKEKVKKVEMERNAEVARRIKAVRGEQTQAEFAKRLEVTQPMVSSWEAGRDLPSSEMYFRLTNAAALAGSSDDCVLFLEQAGLQPDAIISVADVLLKRGEVKMDAILATAENKLKDRMGDQKQMEDEGKVTLVPPFPEDVPVAQQPLRLIPVPAFLVTHKASTYYIEVKAPSIFGPAGHGIAPGDLIVFDASEALVKDPEGLIGEELLVRLTDAVEGHRAGDLALGRVGLLPSGALGDHYSIVLGPPDEPPRNWAVPIVMRHKHRERSNLTIGHLQLSGSRVQDLRDWAGFSSCRILGKFVARFSSGSLGDWRSQARGLY
jgi:transcriptional regulator with XRE-family HTH domain